MAENIFVRSFCEAHERLVCTTSADLNFDNYTDVGKYYIYEDTGNGTNKQYIVLVDYSKDGCKTQTKLCSGNIESRCYKDEMWGEWEKVQGENKLPADFATIYNYGDSSVVPSDASLFTFTELDNGTFSIAAASTQIAGDIVIPFEYKGKPVTAIPEHGFRACTNMTSIIIPNSIREIGQQAFHSCQFTKLIMPGSVKTIERYTFFGCNKMTDLIISEGVETLKENAFHSCTSITHIEIPQSLTEIGVDAFEGAGKVKDIYYNGSKKQFDTLNVGADLLWQATIYCSYVDETALAKAQKDIDTQSADIKKNKENISTLSTGLAALQADILKGMQIKEFILYPGETFEIKPNTIFVAFPPDKTMEIYKADGTAAATNAGIIGAVCSEMNASDNMFRACTFYQQSGALMASYTASYFYFKEGAYIKYTGTSGYTRVLCNVPVSAEE